MENLNKKQNPKRWDAMSKPVWERLLEWAQSREPLKSFRIPEGEEITMLECLDIWKPKDKEVKPSSQFVEGIDSEKNQMVKKLREKLSKKVAALESELSERDEIIKKQEKEIAELVCLTKIEKSSKDNVHPFEVKELVSEQQFTDTARMKIALDIEINLVINGQRVQL